MYEIPKTECAKEGCKNAYTPHRWGSTKAHGKGWFQQKDGTVWCPEHTPEWVEEWRARKKK